MLNCLASKIVKKLKTKNKLSLSKIKEILNIIISVEADSSIGDWEPKECPSYLIADLGQLEVNKRNKSKIQEY